MDLNSSHNKEHFCFNFGFNHRGFSLTGDPENHVTAVKGPGSNTVTYALYYVCHIISRSSGLFSYSFRGMLRNKTTLSTADARYHSDGSII